MLIRADVKCYYCGYVSGQIEGNPHDAQASWSYRSRSGAASIASAGGRRIRCRRCGGPVFLDEIETVRASLSSPELTLSAP